MIINIFQGKLGNERFLKTIETNRIPRKNELISIEEQVDYLETYRVIDVLYEYTHVDNTINLFVELYDWEI